MPPKTHKIRPGDKLPEKFENAAPKDGVANALSQSEAESSKSKSSLLIPAPASTSNSTTTTSSHSHKHSRQRGVTASEFFKSLPDDDDDKPNHVANNNNTNTSSSVANKPVANKEKTTSTPSTASKSSTVNSNSVASPSSPSSKSTPTPTPASGSSTQSQQQYFDDDCDLCNERLPLGELQTFHVPIEHCLLTAWMDTISSDENVASVIASKPKVSSEKAKQIGQLALQIAKKKDGGPLVWQAASNVLKQIRAAVRHKNLELRIFGSCVAMGTWDGVGDVDLCFVRPAPHLANISISNGNTDEKKRNANDDDDDDDDDESEYKKKTSIQTSNNNNNHTSGSYNMESVTTPKDEVMRIAAALRRSGFAFDDLEPVLNARVPIVKHHHKAPEAKDRTGWESIATQQDARSITVRFGNTKLSEAILDLLTNHAPGCRWENDKRDFVIVAENTNAAVEVYVEPWNNFMKGIINNYAKKMTEKIASLENDAMIQASEANSPSSPRDDEIAENFRQEIAKCKQWAADVDRWTRGSFEAAVRSIDWYSSKFFHFPEMYHCDFDLSFRAHGIRNSILLRSYFSQSPLARVGALLVKQWSKDTAVNLSMRGYWTTYCVNIIWLAFLIHKKIVKFVDPRSIPVFVTDAQFDKDIFQYIPTLGTEQEMKALFEQDGGEKLGSLLFDFFYFYGYEFDWSKHVVTLRSETPFTRDAVSTAANPWTHDNEVRAGRFRDRTWYRLCVDDPYEDNLSLGRHLSPTKATRILTHFRMMALKLMNLSNININNNNQSQVLKTFASINFSSSASTSSSSSSSSSLSCPLIPSLKPEDEKLLPAYFRNRFVRWFVGRKSMPLSTFIETFIKADFTDLLNFGSANAFITLSQLLGAANAGIAFENETSNSATTKQNPKTIENAIVKYSNEAASYISNEVYTAVLEIEKKLMAEQDNSENNDNDNNDPGFLVTPALAKTLHLPGNFIAPLKTFFEFTDLHGGQEFRIFKTKEGLTRFVSKNRKSGGAASSGAAGNNNNNNAKDRRDPSRSWIGTCDDCGMKQRRLFPSAVNTKDRSAYCSSCWDIYEKS